MLFKTKINYYSSTTNKIQILQFGNSTRQQQQASMIKQDYTITFYWISSVCGCIIAKY